MKEEGCTENLYGGLQVYEDAARPFSREERLRKIAGPLLHWFRASARVLPWRTDPTPYHVWVSEIMLQQTRVEAVKPYYSRFMERLPGIRELAEAQEEELLKLWEGLGYYSRVRNMKKAAEQVLENWGGELPGSSAGLQKLPGIGSYTAGAIASIAFGLPEPAVDGNVLRVISRITASRADIGEASTKKAMEQELRPALENCGQPGDLNQALMELGATVCLPNGAPCCDSCPVSGLCLAKRQNLTEEIPVKAPKKPRKIEEKTIFLVEWDGAVLVQKRPEKGLLASLYEFPWKAGKMTDKDTKEQWQAILGVPVSVNPLGEAKHIFTHIEWRMTGYAVVPESADHIRPELGEVLPEAPFWASESEVRERYSVPSALRTYAKWIGKVKKDKPRSCYSAGKQLL